MRGWLKPLSAIAIGVSLCAGPVWAGPADVRDDRATNAGQNPNLNHILKAFELPRSDYKVPPPPDDGPAPDEHNEIRISDMPAPMDSIGVLSESNGGFKQNVWRYLTESETITLFSKLPKTIPAGSLRDGLYRLLMSQTNPPRNDAQNWTKIRTAALLQIGAVSSAAQLLAQLPDHYLDMQVIPFYAYTMILGGRNEQACKAVAKLPPDIEPQYQRLQIFCGVISGHGEKAEMALSLREEQGIPEPEWFTTAMEHIQSPTATVAAPRGLLEPTDLAMFLYGSDGSAFKEYKADALLSDQNLQYHPLIASNNALQAADRLLFLESAARYDDKAQKALKSFYDFVVLPTDHPAAKRIASYQQLSKSKNVKMALDNLGETIALFDTPELLPIANMVLREPIQLISQMLKDSKLYPSFAPKAFAIMLRSNDLKNTDLWLKLMDKHAPNGVFTYISYELQRFAAPPKAAYSPSELILPPLANADALQPKEKQALLRFYRLMATFNYHIPDATLAALHATLDAGQPATKHAEIITAQAEKGNLAGVILHAIMAQGGKDLSLLDDATAVAISSGLQKAGNPALARKFAIDAMLAHY